MANFPTDRIHGVDDERDEPSDPTAPTKIIVADEKDAIIIGIDSLDRDGLLLDISKGLARLNLSLQKTESVVRDGRSVSLWFVARNSTENADIGMIWTVLEVRCYCLEKMSCVSSILS